MTKSNLWVQQNTEKPMCTSWRVKPRLKCCSIPWQLRSVTAAQDKALSNGSNRFRLQHLSNNQAIHSVFLQPDSDIQSLLFSCYLLHGALHVHKSHLSWLFVIQVHWHMACWISTGSLEERKRGEALAKACFGEGEHSGVLCLQIRCKCIGEWRIWRSWCVLLRGLLALMHFSYNMWWQW